MKTSEEKFVCALISLVANAIATGTISEAEDYLQERYLSGENKIVDHAFAVMDAVKNKQQYETGI